MAKHLRSPSTLLLLCLFATSGGCDPPPPLPPLPAPELHGRRAIQATARGPVYWFDAGRRPVIAVTVDQPWRVVWHRAGDDISLAHEIDRRPAAPDGRPAMSFLRVDTDPPAAGPGELRVFVEDHVVAAWPAEWHIDPEQRPAVLAWRRGDPLDDAGLDGLDRFWIGVETARAAMRAGHSHEAEEAWLRASAFAAAMDLRSEQSRCLAAAAYAAGERRSLTAMSDHLDKAERIDVDDTGVAITQQIVALAAIARADWRGAEAALARGEAAAVRAGLDAQRVKLLDTRAHLLAEQGRHTEALELMTALRADPQVPDSERTRLAFNEGWLMLRAVAAGARPLDRAVVQARFDAAAPAMTAPPLRLVLEINRTWTALLAGDLAAAALYLAAARAADPAGETANAPYVDLLDGRLALATRDLDRARRLFDALDARVVAELGPDGGDFGWRADLGRARVARARGDLAQARADYERGLRRLDRIGVNTSLREARVPFFNDRRELVEEAVAAALDAGDAAAAFTIADDTRGQLLRGFQAVHRLDPAAEPRWRALSDAHDAARARLSALRVEGDRTGYAAPAAPTLRSPEWQRRRAEWQGRLAAAEAERTRAFDAMTDFLDERAPSADDTGARDPAALIAALRPGEAILSIGHRPGARVALWATADGYHATALPAPLTALPPPPAPIEHLYVVASGHPDLIRLAVASAVERGHGVSLLPVAAWLLAAPAAPGATPVIIADPTWELPEARAEGHALAASHPLARALIGDDARLDAVRAALTDAAFVHFSGHGVLHADRPWEAQLSLADRAWLDTFDVLSLRVPGVAVILNGCETGADALAGRDDVLGLPEAFLVAGAQAVVAADRKLPDHEARRFAELFHQHGGPHRPGPALAATMRILRAEGHQTWDAWRLMGRPAMPTNRSRP